MHRQCSHSFSWPIRALDGRYYRTCRLCGCKHEFDWKKMCGVEQGPAFTDPFLIRNTVDGPSLSLLPTRESIVRTFVENLLFCSRSQPRTVVGYRPGMLWRNVFLPSGAPWRWFGRSLLCHAVAIAVIATALRPSRVTAHRPGISADSQITYYGPTTFPARAARPSTTFRHRGKVLTETQAQAALRVAPGRRTASATLTAPQIRFPKSASSGIASLGNGLVAPALPSSALSQFHLKGAPGQQFSAVGPAPEVRENLRGSLSLSQGPIVGPPSNLAGIPSQRRMIGPGSTLVAPAPSVQGIQRSAAGVSIGNSTVVAPAPQIASVAGNPSGKRGAPGLGGPGDAVAPAPKVAGIGRAPYGKSGAPALTGSGEVVAPAPQIAGIAGNPYGKRGAAGLGGSGDVVAPAPQVAGTFSGRGSKLPQSEIVGPAPGTSDFHPGLGSGKAGGFGVGYVPAAGPAPQVSGLGGGAGGRTGVPDIGSGGPSVVAPPPALQGSGITAASGSGSASAGGGLPVAAAAPPVQQQATNNSSEAKAAGELPAPESVDNSPPGSVQEFSLHLVGVASALPTSSYFSNYEVFIAERRLTRLKSQLIKLVYMFLPYQRRLSEFGTAKLRTLKLRVKRDPSCDESLLDITWPDAASRQHATDANPEANSKAKLPCYRTSADDYRRALAKVRD